MYKMEEIYIPEEYDFGLRYDDELECNEMTEDDIALWNSLPFINYPDDPDADALDI